MTLSIRQMFAIVEFLDVKGSTRIEISIVPLNWICNDNSKCYFPLSTRGQSFEKFVFHQTPSRNNWPKYKISKIHYKTESYQLAEQRLTQILNIASDDACSTASSVKSLVQKEVSNSCISDASEDENVDMAEYRTAEKRPYGLREQDDAELEQRTKTARLVETTEGSNRYLDNNSPVQSRSNTRNSSFSSWGTSILNTRLEQVDDSSITTKYSKDFQESVLSALARISENVQQHSEILTELARQSRNLNVVPRPDDLPDFPLKTLEDFQQFDKSFQEGPRAELVKSYMMRRLAAVGGSGMEQLTRRMLRFLMTDRLAMLFNWKGRDKLSFEKTNIMSVIFDAAKMNYPPNEQSDKIIANSVANWLKLAKARIPKK